VQTVKMFVRYGRDGDNCGVFHAISTRFPWHSLGQAFLAKLGFAGFPQGDAEDLCIFIFFLYITSSLIMVIVAGPVGRV
jgi:hypothetical protein